MVIVIFRLYCGTVLMWLWHPLLNPAQWFLTFDSVLLLPSCQPSTEYISETIELSPARDLTIKLLRWMKKPGFYCYTNICCFIFNLTYFTLISTATCLEVFYKICFSFTKFKMIWDNNFTKLSQLTFHRPCGSKFVLGCESGETAFKWISIFPVASQHCSALHLIHHYKFWTYFLHYSNWLNKNMNIIKHSKKYFQPKYRIHLIDTNLVNSQEMHASCKNIFLSLIHEMYLNKQTGTESFS